MIAVCVAAGPSFTQEQADLIIAARAADRCRVIVVNRMGERIPNADVLYAADLRWWNRYVEEVRASGFAGELWTICPDAARIHGLCSMDGRGEWGVSRKWGVLHTGSNSGYQAIGLAYHFGGEPILLAGYDMQHTDGRRHSHEDYPEGWGNSEGVAGWVEYYDRLYADLKAEGVPIINCSLATAIKTIPHGRLSDYL